MEQLVTNDENEILYYNDQYILLLHSSSKSLPVEVKPHIGISRNSLRMTRFHKYTPQRPRAAFEIRVHRKICTT